MNSEARGIFSQVRPTRPLRPMNFGCLFRNDQYLQKQVFLLNLLVALVLLGVGLSDSVIIVMFIKVLCVAYHFI